MVFINGDFGIYFAQIGDFSGYIWTSPGYIWQKKIGNTAAINSQLDFIYKLFQSFVLKQLIYFINQVQVLKERLINPKT